MTAQTYRILRLCLTHLHRLPSECPHLTVRDMALLDAYAKISEKG